MAPSPRFTYAFLSYHLTMRKQARMPRVELPSEQADGTHNCVDLK